MEREENRGCASSWCTKHHLRSNIATSYAFTSFFVAGAVRALRAALFWVTLHARGWRITVRATDTVEETKRQLSRTVRVLTLLFLLPAIVARNP
jgi:hypothetical protein